MPRLVPREKRPRKTHAHARQPGPLPSVNDLIWPIFVRDGEGVEEPVVSMPGACAGRSTGSWRPREEAHDLGIPAICLFPYTDPSLKTELCEEAWNPDNLSNRAIRAIKAAVPDLAIMTDIALDPYNANGHDGIVRDGIIVNDETVEALVKMALAQAEAGADILGPSDMMDGRIGAMRTALEPRGTRTSRSCPMPRNSPRPLRPVPRRGGRLGRAQGRQEDLPDGPRQPDEALRCVERDLPKAPTWSWSSPAMPYLDICRR
jgi:porphobilinogen synthase